ncbi:MAG: hypothetical protein BWY68_00839 [bacterium ADurb.Bin400]|nr:MAG: hypothetical protein BWY68_00839 [bacterium ADurb.Bin400]
MLRGKDETLNTRSWDVEYLKGLERKNHVKIKTVHAPIDFELSPQEYLPKTCSFVKEIGADFLIMHLPGDKEKYSEYIRWFDYFKGTIDKQEIVILIENLVKNHPHSGPETFNQFPNFCFDVSHSLQDHLDLIAVIEKMQNIRQFHLSYFDGQNDHLKLTLNKELFKQIISLAPNAYRCLELKPHAFLSSDDKEAIIRELKQELEFVKNL